MNQGISKIMEKLAYFWGNGVHSTTFLSKEWVGDGNEFEFHI